MTSLSDQIAALPTITADGQTYLSYQAVIETVAASLFPEQSQEEIDAAAYQRILEAADAHCREAGYTDVIKLTPPTVPMAEMGLYWTAASPSPHPTDPSNSPDSPIIHAGPGRDHQSGDCPQLRPTSQLRPQPLSLRVSHRATDDDGRAVRRLVRRDA